MTAKKIIHRGYQHDRIKFDNLSSVREKVFADTWEDECKIRPGINSGFGLLQDLFEKSHGFEHVITQKEAWIVATVIQWLGSNIGMCFLGEVFKKMGYYQPSRIEDKPCTFEEVVNGKKVKTVKDVENVCAGMAKFLSGLK